MIDRGAAVIGRDRATSGMITLLPRLTDATRFGGSSRVRGGQLGVTCMG
jgi:hypothetical protein